MAKEKVIITDGTEMILFLKGNAGREPHNFAATDVQSISYVYFTNGLIDKIKKKKTRRIIVATKTLGTIEFDENRHKQFFDDYVEELRAYCKRSNVTFADFPKQ